MLTLFILSYTLGAVVTYGASFAYWQSCWHGMADKEYKVDMMHSIFFGVVWPTTLIATRRKFFQSGLKFY